MMTGLVEFPSLFVAASEREEFLARLESPRGRSIWDRVLAEAEEAARELRPAEERSADGSSGRASVGRLGRVIETCCLAHFVTGEERFAQRAREALLDLVAMERWAIGPPSRLRDDLQTGTMGQGAGPGLRLPPRPSGPPRSGSPHSAWPRSSGPAGLKKAEEPASLA